MDVIAIERLDNGGFRVAQKASLAEMTEEQFQQLHAAYVYWAVTYAQRRWPKKTQDVRVKNAVRPVNP